MSSPFSSNVRPIWWLSVATSLGCSGFLISLGLWPAAECSGVCPISKISLYTWYVIIRFKGISSLYCWLALCWFLLISQWAVFDPQISTNKEVKNNEPWLAKNDRDYILYIDMQNINPEQNNENKRGSSILALVYPVLAGFFGFVATAVGSYFFNLSHPYYMIPLGLVLFLVSNHLLYKLKFNSYHMNGATVTTVLVFTAQVVSMALYKFEDISFKWIIGVCCILAGTVLIESSNKYNQHIKKSEYVKYKNWYILYYVYYSILASSFAIRLRRKYSIFKMKITTFISNIVFSLKLPDNVEAARTRTYYRSRWC